MRIDNRLKQEFNILVSSGNNWTEAIKRVEDTRTKFAELIGAEVDEIAVLSSVSDAISAIAMSLPYKKGKNKVIFTNLDFPTVGHIWLAQEGVGANIGSIYSSNRMTHLEQYDKEITEDTILTCIPHVN